MQPNRQSTIATKGDDNIHKNTPKTPFLRAARNTMVAGLTVGLLTLSGCQTFKSLTGGDDDAVITAEKTDSAYYRDAIEAMEKGRYLYASEQLSELRTFYPTGPYAEQALLDLMYSQFETKEYELAAGSAEQFIKLYPNNEQVDYAYYVRGVSNMQAGTSALLSISRLNQAHRDTSYLRLAFDNFLALISRYPNSRYAPDAAQRMSYIYNQFAESELEVSRWYIQREAYVAAANRAKWVFQYFPLSPQVPEAVATMAYSYDQLGLTDLADQYKTLLQINYPKWLTATGQVRLDNGHNRVRAALNSLTFGKLGQPKSPTSGHAVTPYTGPTRPQKIQQAAQLRLPAAGLEGTPTQAQMPKFSGNSRGGINVGLSLPERDTEITHGQGSPSNTAIESRDNIDAFPGVNEPRRNTVPMTPNNSIAIKPRTPAAQIIPNVLEDPELSNPTLEDTLPAGRVTEEDLRDSARKTTD